MKELPQYINCRTQEEQEIVLDIFEMLGYNWHAGQKPRGYLSRMPPMAYGISRSSRSFGNDHIHDYGTEASDLRNMWISLKRRQG